jgi:hypothetical protein
LSKLRAIEARQAADEQLLRQLKAHVDDAVVELDAEEEAA